MENNEQNTPDNNVEEKKEAPPAPSGAEATDIKEEARAEEEAKPEKSEKEEPEKEGKFAYLKPGMTIKVHQKIKEMTPKGEKERIQIFEGIILGVRNKKNIGATLIVRKKSEGIGVEKIFPLNSPIIAKIEPVKQAKVRRAKLFYLRTSKKKLKEKKA